MQIEKRREEAIDLFGVIAEPESYFRLDLHVAEYGANLRSEPRTQNLEVLLPSLRQLDRKSVV